MREARTRWPRQRDSAPPGSAASPLASVTPTDMDVCLRACAAHSTKLVAGLDRRRAALAEALRHLLAVHAATRPAPSTATAPRSR